MYETDTPLTLLPEQTITPDHPFWCVNTNEPLEACEGTHRARAHHVETLAETVRVRFARTFEMFEGAVLEHDDPHIGLHVMDHDSDLAAEARMTLREAEAVREVLTRALDTAKFHLSLEQKRRAG